MYGALALGRPILYVGPRPSHVTDLLAEDEPAERLGWWTPHGDVDAAIETIDAIRQTPPEELRAMGERAAELVRERFDTHAMIERFCDAVVVRR